MRLVYSLPIVLSLVALTGCDRAVVSGRVINVRGEALPGVAVMVEGTDTGMLTDGLGRYRIPQQPGVVALTFSKTGYAPGRLVIGASDARGIEPRDVVLWTLPTSAGVYLFEGGAFRPTSWPEPRQYFLGKSETAYGTVRNPEVVTRESRPFLVCYKMPRFDALLSRLERGKGRVRSGDVQALDVLFAVETRPVDLRAMEETGGRLFRVELNEPLGPGVYALHWGALIGRPAVEKRVFLFEVIVDNVGEVAPLLENR